MKKKYQNIDELLKHNLNDQEEINTSKLIATLKGVKLRWYLTRDEFIKIGLWKSPRPKKLYLQNTEEDVVAITKRAFTTNSEIEKIVYLTRLKGVKIPAASAILTLTDPQNYGVIDIRVWQVFYLYDIVKNNPKGLDFDANDRMDYLSELRKYAEIFHTSVRNIERILFLHHQDMQEGTLYW